MPENRFVDEYLRPLERVPPAAWRDDYDLPALPLPRTPMFGREMEVAAAGDLLLGDNVPIVTLTGPGGVGKTRLALQLAAQVREEFRDGVAWVALAPIREPELVFATIALTLGIRASGDNSPAEQLTASLRDRQFLLALDNFEQVLAAAPLLAALVGACQSLKVLVTSRAAHCVSGEHTFAVAPLEVPPPDRQDWSGRTLLENPAVQLFAARAKAARSGFVLSDLNSPSIARICQRLDGLPLAIELAAARVAFLPPGDLLARLECRLPLLTGGARDAPARQQTMRDTISWSYDLLGQAEQALYRRLGVFAGGISLDAAEAVVGSEERSDLAVVEGLASLVRHSLLDQQEDPHGHARFSMLETVREDAMERLAASGEQDEIHRLHATYFLSMSETRGQGSDQGRWLERIDLEHDNLRAVLEWSIGKGDRESAQRLIAALWIYFWAVRGFHGEGRTWANRVRGMGPGSSPRLYAGVLFAAGEFAATSNEMGEATTLAREALATAQAAGDDLLTGMALHHLAKAISSWPDSSGEDAGTMYEQARGLLANAVTYDERRTAAAVTHNLAVDTARRGDFTRAEALAAEALVRWRELGNNWGTAGTLAMLADTALDRGDPVRAALLGQQSLALCWELRSKVLLIDALRVVAISATADRRQAWLAARLWGAADGLVEETGIVLSQDEQSSLDRGMAAFRVKMGEKAFSARLADGRVTSLEQIVAEALAWAPATPDQDARHGLTPRELDVLSHVACRRSDREIANELFLSRRTVNAHVANILAKLDVATRREAVAKARGTGLIEAPH